MKRTELRIGNLVQNEQGLICKISKIDNEDNNHLIRGWQIRNEAYGTEKPEPIILNKDWMDKFGFYHKYKDTADSNLGIFILNGVNISIQVNGWYSFVDNYHITPTYKYVHQLQNLYYTLTGKELIFDI